MKSALDTNADWQQVLAEHSVTNVEQRTLRVTFPRNTGVSASFGGFGRELFAHIVVVSTDRGARGWGRRHGPECNLEYLVGRRVSDLFDCDVGVAREAHAFDFALHDLAGQILDLPVARLLSGESIPAVPCYEGTIAMEDAFVHEGLDGVAAVVERCEAAYAIGYRAFKLKIGRGQRWMTKDAGLKRDIEVTRAVRERFPTSRLCVDANDAFSCDEALRYVKEVSELGLYWIEEPFPEERDSLLRLKEVLAARSPATLIADGETDFARDDVLALAGEGLIDVLVMDVGTLGFTGWREVLRVLEGTNVTVSPHTCCNPLKIAYAAQLAASNSKCVDVESYEADIEGISMSEYAPTEGQIRLPLRPGFGLDCRPCVD